MIACDKDTDSTEARPRRNLRSRCVCRQYVRGHLDDNRIDVVVIELDANNPDIELCRSLGVPVIIGDTRRQRTLQAAGAHHASRVLAITPDDAVNTQIVATVRELAVRRSREQRCLA